MALVENIEVVPYFKYGKPSVTESIARSMQSKFQDLISIRDFGGVGDGVTDDSAALTNALRYGSVFIPEGSYLIREVSVPANRSIHGLGYSSRLVVPAGAVGLRLGNTTAATTIAYYDGCHLSGLHLFSASTSTGTVGMVLDGISSSSFKDIYFTKLHTVIQQDHAEGCLFENISNSDLEDGATDPVFVVYAAITKRSNDNIYKGFVARSSDTEIYLGTAPGAALTAQHDGVTIEGNILFPCSRDNVYVSNGRMGRISNNELFVAGRNGIRLDTIVTNMSIVGNNIPWSGRFTAGGADAILIQTVSGTPATAYGQVDISNNIISMPSGNGIRVTGVGQVTISGNTIVSPNNIKTTVTGPFTPKQYDGIRFNNCRDVLVTGNNVCTGRHGQGGDDFSTNWRYDVYSEAANVNGTIDHSSINVANLSTAVQVLPPRIARVNGRNQTSTASVNSPYLASSWSSTNGTVTTAAATNPYSGEFTNVVLRFTSTGTSSAPAVFTQPNNVTVAGDSLGANFKIRSVNPTSAYVTCTLQVAGTSFITRSFMVGNAWGEIDMRRLFGAPAGAVVFSISTADNCIIEVAELRVTRTPEAPATSGTYWGTSAPVAGYFKLGDVVYNSSPSTGTAKGWVCTASGTPGTWASIGSL